MPENSIAKDKPTVFISYSRDDVKITDQIEAGLRLTGFEPILDRHGIFGAEKWEEKLGTLIRDADTVVLVLSPSSLRSSSVAWEIEQAIKIPKRIVPVVVEPVGGSPQPEAIQQLNYVYFYDEAKVPGSGFATGLAQLVDALNTDVDWMREHTRLFQRAREWEAGGRHSNRLLTGADIAAAQAWAARRPKKAPEITDLHLDFIKASEAEDARLRGRQILGGVLTIMGSLALVLAGFAVWQWQRAEAARAVTVSALKQVEVAKATVEKALTTTHDSLCKQAVGATAELSSTTAASSWDQSYVVFWVLYWGPMIALETFQKDAGLEASEVETAMVRFGNRLDNRWAHTDPLARHEELLKFAEETRSPGLPRVDQSQLQQRAADVASACRRFVGPGRRSPG